MIILTFKEAACDQSITLLNNYMYMICLRNADQVHVCSVSDFRQLRSMIRTRLGLLQRGHDVVRSEAGLPIYACGREEKEIPTEIPIVIESVVCDI